MQEYLGTGQQADVGIALPFRCGQVWLREVSPFLDVPAGAVGPFVCPSAPVPGQEPRSPQGPFRGRRADQEEVDINSIREYFILL